MAEAFVQAAPRLAECCALLAIGYNLKQSGILRTSDGETAIKLAATLTIPSVILQAFGKGGPLGGGAASLVGVAAVCMGAQLAATWLYVMPRPVRERSVLAGSVTGMSLQLFGYPLVDCFLGARGGGGGDVAMAAAAAAAPGVVPRSWAALQSVALIDVINHLAVWIGSYMLFAGAGPAFPETFPHEDGGQYRGQWRGMRKEGLGVYTYSSGARYEGEWRNNLKEGRGVYYFPKGGVYEGEWSSGSMNGLGVRTFSTGQVKAGRWRDGKLETSLELWQVALASDGATAVAAAARSVEVGGGRWVDAAQMLAVQPTLWALLAGIALNVARVPLPPSIDTITGVLAQANTPLMLLAAGITAPSLLGTARGLLQPQHQPQQQQPQYQQQKQLLQQVLPDIARLLGARLLVPLAVVLNLLALLAAGGGSGPFPEAQTTLLPLAAALVTLLAPVPPQAFTNARRFRLNEATVAAVTAVSYLVCVPLMLLAGVATCAAGLGAPTAVAIADLRPLGIFTLAALAAVSAAVGYVSRASSDPSEEDRRVLMVYAGPVEAVAQGSSSRAAAALAVAPLAAIEGSPPTPDAMGTGQPGVSVTNTTMPPSPSRGPEDFGGSSGCDSADGGAGPNLPPIKATAMAVTPMPGAASCWASAGRTAAVTAGCCRSLRRGLAAAGRAACTAQAAVQSKSYISRSLLAYSGLSGGALRQCTVITQLGPVSREGQCAAVGVSVGVGRSSQWLLGAGGSLLCATRLAKLGRPMDVSLQPAAAVRQQQQRKQRQRAIGGGGASTRRLITATA